MAPCTWLPSKQRGGLSATDAPEDLRRKVEGDTVTLSSVQSGSSAVYQCNASNEFGYLMANAFVNVLGELNQNRWNPLLKACVLKPYWAISWQRKRRGFSPRPTGCTRSSPTTPRCFTVRPLALRSQSSRGKHKLWSLALASLPSRD